MELEFDSLCSICMENRNEIVLSKCYHPFCKACIGEWREKAKKMGHDSGEATCPLCCQAIDEASDAQTFELIDPEGADDIGEELES